MALLLAVVILAVITATMGAIAWQTNAGRRLLDDRQQQLQAVWLARAGIEHGCARLLAEPDKYTGEAIELIPQGRVHISIERESKTPNLFRLVSEAHYPADEAHAKGRTLRCEVRRMVSGGQVRLQVEILPAEFEPQRGGDRRAQGNALGERASVDQPSPNGAK